MIIKQLKHDLVFGRALFIALGIGIVIAAIAGRVAFFAMEDEHTAHSTLQMGIMLGLGLVLGFVAVHFSQFIEKSMFGDSGYLTLTLPISRGRLLVSKLLTCWVWFNFSLLAVFIATVILENARSSDPIMESMLPPVSMGLIAIYINLTFAFFFAANVMLFGLTLHNSVFGKWKVPGFITTIISLGTVFAYSAAAIRLFRRSRELVYTQVSQIVDGVETPFTRSSWQNEMGLSIGRIEMFGSYVDIYIAGIGLAIGLIAFFGTLYLLKKRVSLQ